MMLDFKFSEFIQIWIIVRNILHQIAFSDWNQEIFRIHGKIVSIKSLFSEKLKSCSHELHLFTNYDDVISCDIAKIGCAHNNCKQYVVTTK